MPPPPPPPGQFPLGQYGYSSWEAGYRGPYEGPAHPPRADGLHTEKVVCFTIFAALYGFGILVSLVIVGAINSMLHGEMGEIFQSGQHAGLPMLTAILWVSVLGETIAAVVWLSLIWFALFGTKIMVKWGCTAWTAIGSLGSLWTVFSPGPITAGEALGPSADVVRRFAVVFALLNLAFSSWFISILYRDAQEIQQG
jgi:hypothetical protein